MNSDAIETYQIWAPDGVLWTAWAKPVLFAQAPGYDNSRLELPEVQWAANAGRGVMVIVDRPDTEGVLEGLALARAGFRPVPLYNGVSGPDRGKAAVPVQGIATALYKGANELRTFDIRPDAPPAFLLDANRMSGVSKPAGKFDNRWCVFPQDMPSAAYLRQQGIQQVILRSDRVREDLSHILCRYQEQGIQICQCGTAGQNSIQAITVAIPPWYKSLLYRFMTILGLTRNAAGGFGARIPDPMERNSGGYYRMG